MVIQWTLISISALSATSSPPEIYHSPKAYTRKNNRVGGNNYFHRPNLSYAPLSLLRLGRAALVLAAFQQGVTYRHAEQRRGKNADLGLHVAGGVAKGESRDEHGHREAYRGEEAYARHTPPRHLG